MMVECLTDGEELLILAILEKGWHTMAVNQVVTDVYLTIDDG